MRHLSLVAAAVLATLTVRAPDASAACQVTEGGSVICGAATRTTATTNQDGAASISSDRTQVYDNGAPITASIGSGVTLSGVGLALVEQRAAQITMTNAGQLTTAYPGNALQLVGDGAPVSYSGNGSITSTSTSSNGNANGGAALDLSNVGSLISVKTGSGAISGPQGIDASATQSGAVTIATGTGAVTGTVAQGIFAATGSGSLSITVGSGGVSSTGLGWPAIGAASTNGSISITANGAVTGGGLLPDPRTAPPGILATSNGIGNIAIGGAGTVTGPAGRGIWAMQSNTGLGGIQITGTGATRGLGGLCPGNVTRQTAIKDGEFGCSGIRGEIDNPADNANITITRSGNVTGTSTAINGRTAGDGTITISTGLNAQLQGVYGFGIEGKSSGAGSMAITTSGAGSSVVTGGTGILAVNDSASVPQSAASKMTVTTQGTITSTGNSIAMRDIENPLGVLAGISAGYLGGQDLILKPAVSGTVSVTNAATLNVAAGDGILAYDFGRGSIAVTNSAPITATTGIAVFGSDGVRTVVTNSGDISGTAAAIDASGAGAPVTINQMAGQLTGNILLSPNGDTLNISGGAISGNIVGNSALYGERAGTVNFTAPSFTTGGAIDVAAINLNAGTLTLANDVTVFDSFTNNATLQLPAVATRTITGNYSQSGSGTLVLAVSPAGTAQLAVTGAAQLGGALSLQYAPGTYVSRTYALVTAGGGVSGTFASLTESGSLPTVGRRLVYAATAVDLVVGAGSTVVKADTAAPAAAPAAVTVTAGAGAAAGAAATPADPPASVLAATSPGAPTVVVRPGDESLFSAQATTLAVLAHRSAAALLGTDDAPSCGGPGTFAPVPAPGDIARTPFCRAGGWVQFADSPLHAGGSFGLPGFSANAAHVLLGVDGPVWGDRLRLGVALGYDQSWLSDDSGGQAGGQVVRLSLYGAARLDPVIVTATVGYGTQQLSTRRETGVGAAAASHGGSEVSGGLQARLPITVGSVSLTPLAGVRFAVLNENGFVESGSGAVAGAVVSGGRTEFDTIVPYARLKLARSFATAGGWHIAPAVQVGYDFLAGNAGPPVNLRAGDGTIFTSHALKLNRNSAVLGASISIGPDNWQITGGIHANIAGNWSSQTAEAGYRLRF